MCDSTSRWADGEGDTTYTNSTQRPCIAAETRRLNLRKSGSPVTRYGSAPSR